ncbi:MAG: tyrosine-type recombinase/integrase [Acidimicrobiales bacterium]
MGPAADSFESKIDRSGCHHLWTGSKSARGAGQVRIGGKLHTAARIAWERAHGAVPEGAKVLSCPAEPACVRVEHLHLKHEKAKDIGRRSTRGSGSMSQLGPDTWKLTVDAGRDGDGRRRRVYRTARGTRADATRALAALVTESGENPAAPANASRNLTVNELAEWYLAFARDERGLEHSTLVGYREVYDNWLRDHIGHMKAAGLDGAALDNAFGRMRRGGMSDSRMNNARALISGAYKWGQRHHKVPVNPVDRFELPTSSSAPKPTATPELDELLRLLNGAEDHDPELAPVLKLGATTGMRRGELSGLRRDRLRLDRRELVVDTAINDAGGIVVEKPTKTKRNRTVSLDPVTISLLRQHLADMDQRAAICAVTVPEDGFVFSLDPTCRTPMRPELMTRRMRQLRKALGIRPGEFDATILALRKWTSTELMDAGFNPSTVSGRQGHTVQVMLAHYSTRRRSADQAAAQHLGNKVHGPQQDPHST